MPPSHYFDLAALVDASPAAGWKVTEACQRLPDGPLAPPVEGGSWQIACRRKRGHEFADPSFELPAGEPLTLAAYSAGPRKRAYVEPTAVGRELIDMPLFLEPEVYVNVPLEPTYQAAYRGVPLRWRRVLESSSPCDPH